MLGMWTNLLMFMGSLGPLCGQEVSDGVVEAGQIHCHPGAQEDDVAHQYLVLEGSSEHACLAILLSRVHGLQDEILRLLVHQHQLDPVYTSAWPMELRDCGVE